MSSRLLNTTIEDALEASLSHLHAGGSPQECLDAYPELAEELAPLLETAALLPGLELPTLDPQASKKIRAQMRRAVAGKAPQQRGGQSWLGRMLLRGAVAGGLTFAMLGGTAAAAEMSLPNSPLYPVKRASEELRMRISVSPIQRAELELAFSERRIAELADLAAQGATIDSATLDAALDATAHALETINSLPPEQSASLRLSYDAQLNRQIARLDTLQTDPRNREAMQRLADAQRASLLAVRGQPADTPAAATPSVPPTALPGDAPPSKPEQPTGKPEQPPGKPETPPGKPEQPTGKPEQPPGKPEQPTGKPEQPPGKPEQPTGKPEQPTGKPETPPGKPEQPTGKPEQPTGKPETPPGKPEQPTSPPEATAAPLVATAAPPDVPPGQQRTPQPQATPRGGPPDDRPAPGDPKRDNPKP